ncbi:MAG: homocysteine S-methyltransferase family protein, partial [SAR324 cluster bacterium]|nr:homocysteine S-methyltransferase family protein [SAR324 cluster bacterium]
MSEDPNFKVIPLLDVWFPLVGDGGAETLLRNFGLEENCPPILANLEQPDLVKRMHHAFIRQGSRLIRTNSSFSQADEVLVNRLEACINSASALAREVSNKRAVIAGRITCAPADWGRDA